MGKIMVVLSILVLIMVLAACAFGCGWVTGRPMVNAWFTALIFATFFVVLALGVLISWKLACPISDKWLDVKCLESVLSFGF
ncbi:MAG TPA: hypothetical protein VMV79_03145 [Alphaproteobacteria bacterium]|nr:hypothetical protein [Alphaproteobacteria bacterium]